MAVVTKARETAQKMKESVVQHKPKAESARKHIEKHAFPYATGLSIASIVASLLLSRQRNKDNAIFVGLWAPTLLSLGLFYMLVGPGKSRRED
jgi:hypothetical protein